ncbi:eCIS core domain-containing protein [Streptomyces sp. NPDC002755]|uniref:eCIS core domain-containing protein n=1 Tax=Streptomyces sp. NPDC002884 TaxID=3154544 RepID=UPI003316833E
MRAQDQENDLGGNRRSAAGRGSARSSLPGPAAGLLALQRSAGNAAVTRAIEEQRHEHGPGCEHADRSVQRAAETDEAQQATVQRETSLAEVTGSGGSGLDPRIQAKAEQAYGMSLGHVRVHNDATAQRASADFKAHAMTVGHHIVLGSSRVDDETMFHELDHVRQQSQGPVAGTDNGSGVKVSDPGDAFERQSAANGRLVAQGSTPDLSLPGSAGHGAPVQRAAAGTGERQSVQRMPKELTKSKAAGKGGKKATVAQAITKALVQNHGWKEYGGQQNKTVHFPVASDNAPAHAKSEGLKGAALSAMYHGTSNIRKERSFSAERPEQALRWISTVTFNYLNDLRKQPEEVQAGVSAVQQEGPEGAATRFQLYISSNKDGANKALSDLYEGKASAAEFLTAVLKAGEPNLSSRTALEQRHAQKLASRLLGDGQGREAYSAVLQALGGSVSVPPKREDAATDGLHAERRIVESAPAGSISAIAGVKRPCMVCYMELFVGDDSKRPGPYWPSKASNIGESDYTIGNADMLALRIHTAAVTGGGTHVSLRVDCEGQERVDTGYGSESDSSASDSEQAPDLIPAEAMDLS